MILTVTDPQQHGEGRNKYTSYKVAVRAKSSPDEPKPVHDLLNTATTVRRRYSDFQWLYSRLLAERPGSFVPIIPHQRAVSSTTRFSEELIEERRTNLEIFMRKLVCHPELYDAASLSTFLRADDTFFEAAKKESNAGGSGSGSNPSESDAYPTHERTSSWTESFKHKIHKTAHAFAGVDLEKFPDETEFESANDYVNDLDVLVRALSRYATSIVKHGSDAGTDLMEMSHLFSAMGEAPHHKEYGIRNLLVRISDGALSLSSLGKQRSKSDAKEFDEPFQGLVRMVQAVKIALQQRKECRLEYSTWQTQVKVRQNTLEKARGKKEPNAGKIDQAKTDVNVAVNKTANAKRRLEEASGRIRRELERFKRDMEDHVRKTMLEYAKVQVEYGRRMESEWNKLVPHLMENVAQDKEGGDEENNEDMADKVGKDVKIYCPYSNGDAAVQDSGEEEEDEKEEEEHEIPPVRGGAPVKVLAMI